MRRIGHIDSAKAIGMMLIISSHVWTIPDFSNSLGFRIWDSILNSFYVPLFFILSGVFETHDFSWNKLFKRLIHIGKLIIIFSIFGIIVFRLIKGEWSLFGVIKGTLTWFLITLFWISFIFGIIKRVKFWSFFILLCGICGCWLSKFERSFFYIGQALLCIPFYSLGYFLRDLIKETKFNISTCSISLIIWFFFLYIFYLSPQNISLNIITQSYLSFYIAAVAGSFFTIEICKIVNLKILNWFGMNSLVPLLVQIAFISILGKYFIADSWSSYILLSLIVIVLCATVIPVFSNKYFNLLK